jgi:hypothetical protein
MKKIMKIEEAGYLAAMAKWRNISGHQWKYRNQWRNAISVAKMAKSRQWRGIGWRNNKWRESESCVMSKAWNMAAIMIANGENINENKTK